jgi:hypothetical protein
MVSRIGEIKQRENILKKTGNGIIFQEGWPG